MDKKDLNFTIASKLIKNYNQKNKHLLLISKCLFLIDYKLF